MTDHDALAFAATFQKLRGFFALRGDREEIQQISALYFKVLSRFPLPAVDAGADAWIEKGARFPKPAEWIKTIPRGATATLPTMTADEATEHRRAVALHYEDEPCNCVECTAAGVTHRFLRYVPESDADDRDIRRLLDSKPVTVGHWAHGEELQRWYAARDAYLSLKKTVFKAKAMPAAEVQTDPRTGEPFDVKTDSVTSDPLFDDPFEEVAP